MLAYGNLLAALGTRHARRQLSMNLSAWLVGAALHEASLAWLCGICFHVVLCMMLAYGANLLPALGTQRARPHLGTQRARPQPTMDLSVKLVVAALREPNPA